MLLEKAFLSRFLALSFSYPSEEILGELEGALKDLEKVLGNLNINFPLNNLRGAISSAKAKILDLQGEFTSLFETEMKAPARETSYELDKMARRSMEMADLIGFYRAFGVELSSPIEPDSLVAELEFLSFLYQKEFHLSQKGDEEGVEVTREGRNKFLRDHLGRWYDIFVEKVMESSEEKFYRLSAELLKSFLDIETENMEGIQKLKTYNKETLEGSSWKCGFM